jgi:hypothetical protein
LNVKYSNLIFGGCVAFADARSGIKYLYLMISQLNIRGTI